MKLPIRSKTTRASSTPQEVVEPRVTISTHLIDAQNPRQIQLFESESVYTFFQNCVAAWTQVFHTPGDIKWLIYRDRDHLIKIVWGSDEDLQFLRDTAKREQEAGKKMKADVYLLKEGDCVDTLLRNLIGR
jgi:hypothetical protein